MTEQNTYRDIKTRLSTVLRAQIEEMCKEKGRTISEIVRNALESYYAEFQRDLYGRYKGFAITKKKFAKGEKKDARESKIEALRAMPAEDFTEYLKEIGYTKDEPLDNGGVRKFVIISENGFPFLYDKRYDAVGEEFSSRMAFNFDELISDLKRERKL